MLDSIKQNLFTIHGAFTTLIHVFFVVGLLASWVFIRVQVLGEDFTMNMPGGTPVKARMK